MSALPPAAEPFVRFGPALPACPIVVAVPHAGRAYPPELLAAARLPRELLEMLEDRLVDRLVAGAVAAGATVQVATLARAWIDLNRAPAELDPGMVTPPPPGLIAGVRARGGLGLIPRRVAGHGEIYRAPLPAAAVSRRLAEAHGPWHAALATTLAGARARFGTAVLLDLHSMPPLTGPSPAQVVIGDRHRASAAPEIVAAMLAAARGAGLRVALNAPYAGGYALDRHGRPAQGIHAVQVELCRSLYLDAARRGPGPGMAATAALVARLVEGLAARITGDALAAE